MFILTVKGFEEDGAFALDNDHGGRTLIMFEEEDDADRYAQLLAVDDYPEMEIIEIDDFTAIKACEMHDYEYNIITAEDIVVPPKNDTFQKDKMA